MVLADEMELCVGKRSQDKRSERVAHVLDVPPSEPVPGEVPGVRKVSSVDGGTMWSESFQPFPTLAFLARYGRTGFVRRTGHAVVEPDIVFQQSGRATSGAHGPMPQVPAGGAR
uniref:Crotonyl-CoA reductase n=1 Tax=Streptomyces kanamyceticus TaxID=1967 RepID=E9KTC3_STRKN|nr:crotonyl-CoA reductase [Streptomyces kanamyceticus]